MAGGSRLVSVPFALGIDERTTPRELEPRALREAVNVRQRRLRAFGMRADYLAATMTEFDGTLTPYDLYNLNGRLIALGNRQFPSFGAAPTDLFEYVEQPGGAWKGTLPVGGVGTRLPPVTDLRNVGQTPDVGISVQTARVAALGGLVCLTYGDGSSTAGATSYVHIFRASTDSTLVQASVPIQNTRVVPCGNSFWVLGVDSANDLVGYRFDTTADDALRSPVTLYTGTVTSCIFDAVTEESLRTRFAVFLRDGSTTRVRLFNESGVQQVDFAGPAVAADVLVIQCEGNGLNETVVVTRVGTADALASRYLTSTGVLQTGPTALFGQNVTGDLSITRTANLANRIQVVTEDDTNIVRRWNGATNPTFSGSVLSAHNYAMAGQGAYAGVVTLQPVVTGDSSNQLLAYDSTAAFQYAAAQLDDQIARPSASLVGKGGQVCLDTSTGFFYWARIYEGTDASPIAGVTEVRSGSTERRQACQVGSSLLVTGGAPVSFDGRQATESGFLERPTFAAALSSSNGAGSLISSATYDYVAIFSWVDGQNRQVRSRLSDIQTITLGVLDDTVTASIYAPHTMRGDTNSGSAPIISLYRTDATATLTAAVITGVQSIDPPGGVLAGLTLQIIRILAASYTVTFTAGATTLANVLSEINAVTSPVVVATAPEGVLVLTTAATGPGAILEVRKSGTANTILGFSTTEDTFGRGTATYTRGTVFHLAATAPVPSGNEFGQAVTLTDLTSDANLLLAETLYTQGEFGGLTGILEREAPPSARYAATVGARAFLGGLPDPTEVAVSFELAPAETLAFSSNLAFRAWVDGTVTAVAALDGVPIAFTADCIYRFPNALPNDQGGDGELMPAVRVPSEGGCQNAQSILETSAGLFYESRDGKIMLLPRGGATPVWIGQLVQDSLEAFPVIMGAAYVDEDHCAVFTCRNSGGTASIILVYDLRIGQWYRDTFASAQVIRACVDYLGRLAYIDGATVRLQSSSLTPSAFIPYNAKTGSLAPFYGEHGGWGELICIQVDGEFRGNCTVQCQISYDDGVSFTTLATKTFSTPTFAVGESITIQWYPRVRKGSAFVLNFPVTVLSGAATAGIILNSYTIEVKNAQPLARARTTASQRG